MGVSPTSQLGFGVEIGHIPNPPIPIKFKAKPEKVWFSPYPIETIDGYLSTAST